MLALRPLAPRRHDAADELRDLVRTARRTVAGDPFGIRREARAHVGKAARVHRHCVGCHQLADFVLGFEYGGH